MQKKSYLFLTAALVLGASLGQTKSFALTADVKVAPKLIRPARVTSQGNLSGDLIPSNFPNEDASSNKLQSQSQAADSSLGASGITEQQHSSAILTASTLPASYKSPSTPVLNQNDLGICWDYAGIDSIQIGAKKTLDLNVTNLLPAYYDYLAADNAFSDASNPLAIMYSAGDFRKLGDGNTLDYVPSMSVLGYDPRLTSASLTQNMWQANDVPIKKATFNALKASGLHVSNSYKLVGNSVSSLPTGTALAARLAQIKQLVYQYGTAQIGISAEYSFDGKSDFNYGGLSEQKAANGDLTSYTPYSAVGSTTYSKANPTPLTYSSNGQQYVLTDHEVEIVGWNDSYAASNFKQNPGMNGAFLVKNSWGSGWGNSGYFYLSYADLFLQSSEVIADTVTKTVATKNYTATNTSAEASSYYLDFGSNASLATTNNNLFINSYKTGTSSASGSEILDSISADVEEAGVKVNVLYKLGGVTSNTKLSDFRTLGSYSFTDAGYQTIPFSDVSIPNNTSFSVALQVSNMTSFKDFTLPVQNLATASSATRPVLTSKASSMIYNGQVIPLYSSTVADGQNLYIDAHTRLAKGYKVSFNSNGGSSVSAKNVLPGAKISKPVNPSRAGYRFVGWYSDSGLTKAYDFSSPVNADKTLYAKWKAVATIPVYRLYNKVSLAHLFTASAYEYQQAPKLDANWIKEGLAWNAPASGDNVYRVYQPQSGEHLYTESTNEVSVLTHQFGWKSEGIAFHSMDKSGRPVYRLFNAKAGVGAHFETLSSYERDQLVKHQGWTYEGIAWYAAN
ncbi:InlB B-repeat-containing protein [Lactococcus termiticola]|uniref:Uncharacterized protein n=1 Tax=Lactococcus termiticola TaxID=2169526 RepID=A0A2R5HCX6_9LACT|nr:InlB B-repeat-containing protein [Lactococcus termiticola]GBG95927.1 hypothetical protein NtB2_00029 [Lactococcus termiticola]